MEIVRVVGLFDYFTICEFAGRKSRGLKNQSFEKSANYIKL